LRKKQIAFCFFKGQIIRAYFSETPVQDRWFPHKVFSVLCGLTFTHNTKKRFPGHQKIMLDERGLLLLTHLGQTRSDCAPLLPKTGYTFIVVIPMSLL
jgi:hypothetical protein